jgi:hypothetical protein
MADHARYANLFLHAPRASDAADAASARIRAAIAELTALAAAAAEIDPAVTVGDVMALVWALRGLVHATEEGTPADWRRFVDIHLAGLRTAPIRPAPPTA